MNLNSPISRYQTQKARLTIIESFKWPHEEWTQDWPLEVSQHIDLALCIREYAKLSDDDEKFLLMEGILYALEEAKGENFELHSRKAIDLLKTDFDLHKFTVHYWTLYRYYPEEHEGFMITPLMREVWNSKAM